MDPNLSELLAESDEGEVEAIVRLASLQSPPESVRIVARFGDIATCRLPRTRIVEAWADQAVLSLKAAQRFNAGFESPAPDETNRPPLQDESDVRRPPGLPTDGSGVLVAVIDWGFDFGHDNFRNQDGSTRIRALWDQTSREEPVAEPYGYGRVYSRQQIDAALRSSRPYETLGYHPGASDRRGKGTHGTHVLDIAAGNGRHGGQRGDSLLGLAPGAELLLVHLSSRERNPLANLGDSVTLLEAIDWIRAQAGDTPFVINMSVGRHGGPHTGLTLGELAIDYLLTEAPGRCVVQSAGNYYAANVHASGQLRPGHERILHWRVEPADVTPNELEVWYAKSDALGVTLEPPGEGRALSVPLGGQAPILHGDQVVGRFYHRARDPSNGDHHINIFLYPEAPAGVWRIRLAGEDVVDGRYHCWVERDSSCSNCQSRLDPDDADPSTTTGTICNGRRSIAVGAYDVRDPERPLARFSSAGPTVDGRVKPDLVAPGVGILAAKSTPPESPIPRGSLVLNSGTSMAAPHVAGCVANMFEAAGRPLAIHETRRLLLSSADPAPADSDLRNRIGSGYLNVAHAVEMTQRWTQRHQRPAAVPAEWDGAEPLVETQPVYKELAPVAAAGCGCNRRHAPATSTATEPARPPRASEVHTVRRSMAHFESAIEDAVWPDAESLLESSLGPQDVGLMDPAGEPSSVAALFDSLCGFAGPAPQRHFEKFFEVVAMPGEVIPGGIQVGDIVVGRAYGEGGLGWADTLVWDDLHTEGAPSEDDNDDPRSRRSRRRRRWRRGRRMRHNVMVVRPRRRTFGEPAPPTPRAFAPDAEWARDAEALNRTEVRELQQGLNQLLGTSLGVDGDYGRRTRDAVRQFQRQAGLAVDGIAGSRTMAALRAALSRVEAQAAPAGGASLAACNGLASPTIFDRFEFNRDTLPPAHLPLLRQLAECIVASLATPTPVNTLNIVGHTDPVGSANENLRLGQRRADNLAAALRREIDSLQAGASAGIVMNASSAGETQQRGTPELSRRVEVTFTPPSAPPPAAAATIEVVTDSDNDFRVDAASPVATFVRFGLWDNAYDGSGVLNGAASAIGDIRIRNGASDADNFIGRDQRRFYFRVNDSTARGRVTVRWKTLLSDRSDDDAPASQDLTLNETAPGSGVFVSRAVMLVTDDTDANQPTHSGGVTLIRNRGQSDHRLRRATMEGFIHAEYSPAAGSAVSVALPVFERSPLDERRRLRVRVVNYVPAATASNALVAAEIASQFASANQRWNQVGLHIEAGAVEVRPAPAGMLNAAGVFVLPNDPGNPNSTDSPSERAALNDLVNTAPAAPDNTVTLVVLPMSGANAYATLNPTGVPIGERFFIFMNIGRDPVDVTLAHELHHVLFNRGDADTEIQFFTFVTTPPSILGIPLPDVRVYRRVQDLHSPDPDNDPADNNVINWARRRRTARRPPLGGSAPAPSATTGNTLVETF